MAAVRPQQRSGHMVSTVLMVQLIVTLLVIYQQWSFVRNGTGRLSSTPKNFVRLPLTLAQQQQQQQQPQQQDPPHINASNSIPNVIQKTWMDDRLYKTPRIVMVTPHIIDNVPRLVQSWKTWTKLGSACTTGYAGNVDMLFYINGKAEDYDPSSLVENRLRDLGADMAPVVNCFGSIKTLFAELTPEEDGYPEGINNMFFKLFLDEKLSNALKSYTHMFWMEWDMSPLRAHWLDKLRDEASSDDFWMKGSPYKGESLDAQAIIQGNWDWIGHINGNALYKLHDTDFTTLMRITNEREPPGHFWKPFDVSMWRVLHDMPYSWHMFQAYRDRFRFSDFIVNLGYMVQQDDVQRAQNDPEAYFMHGDAKSAGIVKQNEKFKDSARTSKVEWSDPVPSTLGMSVFIRVGLRNLDYLYLALKSIERHLKGAHEVVIVAPEEDISVFQQMLPSTVKLFKEKALEGLQDDDYLQSEATHLIADTYCTGRYILHLPFDAVLRKEMRMRDIFMFHKPMSAIYPGHSAECKAFRNAAGFFLNTKPEYCFVDPLAEHILPIGAHASTRAALAQTHHSDLPKFLESWKTHQAASSFSAVNIIKTFLFDKSPDQLSWLYMGVDDGPMQVKVPTNFKPVRYPLMCMGRATLTDGRIPLRNKQLAVLEASMKANDCLELRGTIDEIAKQLAANTKKQSRPTR